MPWLTIPESLNLTTFYKGAGKDPLERGSYRGISVTPVISKLFEILILMRLEPHLQDLGIPHPNQTGYQKHTSCTDAIFSTAEMMSHYLEKGENMYLCCCDLLTRWNMGFCSAASMTWGSMLSARDLYELNIQHLNVRSSKMGFYLINLHYTGVSDKGQFYLPFSFC